MTCFENYGDIVLAESATFFAVEDLRKSVDTSKLGPPKSASEGAERDRTWPVTVPKNDGTIVDITDTKIVAELASGRRQTYVLRGKHPYVDRGARFRAKVSILAGTIPRLADLPIALSASWDPLALLTTGTAIDRYAAAKALPQRDDIRGAASTLERALTREEEERVALEIAASAAKLGSHRGFDYISSRVANRDRADLVMESVLILSEVNARRCVDELAQVARSAQFQGNEVRQAAVWGLGYAGVKAYSMLVPFISDQEDEVALHAIAAFGRDTPRSVVEELVNLLARGDPRQRAGASEALRLINTELVLECLVAAARERSPGQPWILVSMGRLDPDIVESALKGDPLLEEVRPLMMLSPRENWLRRGSNPTDLEFLLGQNLPPRLLE